MSRLVPWLVPLAVLALWQFVCHLLAWIGGYFRLIRAFPPSPDPVIEEHRFASGRMGSVRYNNAIHIMVGESGLHLGPNILFRPWTAMNLPSIPWSEVVILKASRYWGGMYTGTWFKVRSTSFDFEIMDPAAKSLVEFLGELYKESEQMRPVSSIPIRPS